MLNWIYDSVTQKTPRQLRFDFALWTQERVADLIERKFGIKLARNVIGRLLAWPGITCRRPLHRATERDGAFVKKFSGQSKPFFLPPCCPDRNPDFKSSVVSSMRGLHKNPQKIRSFHQKPSLKCAA